MKEKFLEQDKLMIKEYLNDILEAANNVADILKNSKDAFKDPHHKAAVERYFEIVGEAAKNLPENFRLRHNNVPWRKIIGMRNIIIHKYRDVNSKDLLLTAYYDLPTLVNNIKKIIKEEF